MRHRVSCVFSTAAALTALSAISLAATPVATVEAVVGSGMGTYIDLDSNPAGVTNGGITGIWTNFSPETNSWQFPDTSNDNISVNGNSADDKTNSPVGEIQLNYSGLIANQLYDIYAIVIADIRIGGAGTANDLEWGTASGSLTLIGDAVHQQLAENNAIAGSGSGGNNNGRLIAVPLGQLATSGAGEMSLFFGPGTRNGNSDSIRTQFDGVLFDPAVDTAGLYFEVDRTTGELTLVNSNPTASPEIVGYTITSELGALDRTHWKSIADNYDASAPGPDQVDPNGDWNVLGETTPHGEFAEYVFHADGHAVLAANQELVLGTTGAWIATANETDLIATIQFSNGLTGNLPIVYAGNDGDALNPLDLNASGGLPDGADWVLFRDNFDSDISALTKAEAARAGDLDGDSDIDFADYGIFRTQYEILHGGGAFDALLSASNTVPEPSTLVLAVVVGALAVGRRASFAAIGGALRSVAGALVAALFFFASSPALAVIAYTGFEGTEGELGYVVSGNEFTNIVPVPAGTPQVADAPRSGMQSLLMNSTVDNSRFTATVTFDEVSVTGVSYPAVVLWAKVGQDGWETDDLLKFSVTHNGTGSTLTFFQGNGAQFEDDPNGPKLEDKGFVRYVGAIPEGATSASLVIEASSNNIGERFFIDDVTFQSLFDLPHVRVSTTTGEVSIRNRGGDPLTLSGYTLRSPGGRLLDTWSGLSVSAADSKVDGPDADELAGSSPGEQWEKSASSDADSLTEFFLSGSSTLATHQSLSLGTAYLTGVEDAEMSFTYFDPTSNRQLTLPVLFFAGSDVLEGDFNNDGLVNLADYTVWRDNLGGNEAALNGNGSGNATVGSEDYDLWKANFGTGSGGALGASHSTNVPEPRAALLFGGIVAGFAALRRRSPTTAERGE